MSFDISSLLDALYSIELKQAARYSFKTPQFPSIHSTQLESSATKLELSALHKFSSMLSDVGKTLSAYSSGSEATVLKSASSSNTTVLTASASSGAQVTSYQVTVNSLATESIASFSNSYASADSSLVSDPNQVGSLTFKIGSPITGQKFSVAVSNGMTAQEFVNSFNSQSLGLATARLVQTDGEFKLVIQSTNTGVDQGALAITADNGKLLESPGLGDPKIKQAVDANISIAGIPGSITRATNVITDAIPDVTLSLQATGTSTVTISPSSSQIETQLSQFVSAYNQVVQYTQSQNGFTIDDPYSPPQYGALATTSVDDNALGAIQHALLGVASQNGQISIGSLGILTNSDGTLSFNKNTLASNFASDPNGVGEAVSSLANALSNANTGVIPSFTDSGGTIPKITQFYQTNDINSELFAGGGAFLGFSQAPPSRPQLALYLAKLSSQSDYLGQLLMSI